MGNLLQWRPNIKVFMIGEGGAGRTTILYQWKLQEPIQTIPTIGFNIETIHHQQNEICLIEVGGGYKIRELWHHYQEGVNALVIVVDSSDLSQTQYLHESIDRIMPVLPQQNLPYLVLANKIDKRSYSDAEILQHAGVNRYPNQIKYHLIHTNGISGEGLNEALDWLVNNRISN